VALHFENSQNEATGWKNSDKQDWSYKVPEVVKVNGKQLDLSLEVPVNWTTGKVAGETYISYKLNDVDPFPVDGSVSTGFGAFTSMKGGVEKVIDRKMARTKNEIEKRTDSISSMKSFLNKPFRRAEELQEKIDELNSIVIDEDQGQNQEEGNEMKSGSNLKMWLSEQDLDSISKKLNLTAEEEDRLRGFAEGDDDNMPLGLVWKLDELLMQENVLVINADIERDQAEAELIQALNKVDGEFQRLKVEAQQKEFESTQVNTDSVGREYLIVENDYNCLSQAMHGKCNNGQTWSHSTKAYVDEAFVPNLDGNFTDASSPDYVKSITQKYNGKMASLRSRVNKAQGNITAVRNR